MLENNTPCVIASCEIIIDLPCVIGSCDAIKVVFDEHMPEDKQIKICTDSGMVALSKKQLLLLGTEILQVYK